MESTSICDGAGVNVNNMHATNPSLFSFINAPKMHSRMVPVHPRHRHKTVFFHRLGLLLEPSGRSPLEVTPDGSNDVLNLFTRTNSILHVQMTSPHVRFDNNFSRCIFRDPTVEV